MAKKKAKPETNPQTPGQDQNQAAAEEAVQPASSRRKPVIALVAFALVAMFLVSFIYRTQNQGLQVQRRAQQADHGNEGQGAMSPEMESAMMGEIGKLMERMRENPDDAELLMELADRFMAMKSWDRAEMFLTRAMVAEPGNLNVLYKLGIVNFEMQRPEDAAGYFEQIVALDPTHAHAQLNLGLLYKHYLEKPQEAMQHFQALMALEEAPQKLKDAAQKELASEHDHEEGS